MVDSEESGHSADKLASLSEDARRLFQFLCCLVPNERDRRLIDVNWPEKTWPKPTDMSRALHELRDAGLIKKQFEGQHHTPMLIIEDSVADAECAKVPESVKQEIARELNLFWH